MKKLKNIHPGEVLKEEFLNELGISTYSLAKDTGVPNTRISEIIKGARRITADRLWDSPDILGTHQSSG